MASYHRADIGDAGALAGAVDPAKGPLVAYLALPPAAFAPAVQALATVGFPDGSRVVVEKPFGRSLAEARALNRLLDRCFGEDAVVRADPFLRCRPSRTSSDCGSPTGFLSRSGTPGTSNGSRSSGTRPSRWRAAPATTTTPVRCTTWFTTICCAWLLLCQAAAVAVVMDGCLGLLEVLVDGSGDAACLSALFGRVRP